MGRAKTTGRPEWLTGWSVTTGCVRMRDLGYLLMTKDSLVDNGASHTRVVTRSKAEWGAFDLMWLGAAAGVCHAPAEKLIAVGQRGGKVFAVGGGSSEQEQPIATGRTFVKRGYLRDVRGIARGKAYAVGTCRQAYRRDAPGQWTCIDAWTKSKQPLTDFSFESIDGFSERDIYVVGWEGEIWHYDGSRWDALTSPTTHALHKVVCAGDGAVYAVGQRGTVLRGDRGTWKQLDSNTDEDLWGAAWHAGTLYASTLHLVYALKNRRMARVTWGDDMPTTCYHLSAADGILWSIGAKDVMELAGKRWTRVL